MNEMGKINKIEDAISISNKLHNYWFRGHSKEYDLLIPKLYRNKFLPAVHITWKNLEKKIIESFRREAQLLIEDKIDWDDSVRWMLLMQHYGVRTRLLDWTRSILIALYFCVIDNNGEDNGEDGELWTILPEKLWEKTDPVFQPAMPTMANEKLMFLFSEPFIPYTKKLLETFEIDEENIPKYPIPVLPPLYYRRMFNQMSTFTIHPQPQYIHNKTEPMLIREKEPISVNDSIDKDYIAKYIIPSKSKDNIKLALFNLGYKPHIVFPDISHLNQTIEHEITKGFATSKPPKI